MVWSWNSGKTARAPQPGDVLQADARSAPAWTRTTGAILPFHGLPKTAAFPHYLDGLPMSVVSQLGYVDRGIGTRGIFSLVDDFMLPWEPKTGDFDGFWGPYRVYSAGTASTIAGTNYIAGALYLVAGQADAHDRAKLWGNIQPFNYVPGRRLWFSTRVSLQKPTDPSSLPTSGSAFIGIVWSPNADGNLDASPGDADRGTGLFFLKKQGETDWSFYIAQSNDGPPSFVVIPNVVTAGLGSPPTGGQYVPLSFQIDATGACIVYVDGNVVGVVPASDPVWSHLGVGIFGHNTLQGDFGFMAAVESGAATEGIIANVDSILIAEETNADAD